MDMIKFQVTNEKQTSQPNNLETDLSFFLVGNLSSWSVLITSLMNDLAAPLN